MAQTLLLDVKQASRSFGGLKAVSDVSMQLFQGELVGLIGPNGAGKTTLFNLLTGVYEPSEGKIILNNESIGGLKPFKITQKGAARTFQNIRLFSNLSIIDNVKIAYHQRSNHSIFSSIFRLPSHYKGSKQW